LALDNSLRDSLVALEVPSFTIIVVIMVIARITR